jgi:hypothetical protein
MKTVPISQLADIRTGFTFREASSGKQSGEILGLQIRDIRNVKVIDPDHLSVINWQGSDQLPTLMPGEVVLAAKGSYNRAALFLGQQHQVIPSSQLLVLSVRDKGSISPSFLCWVLNYPETQRRMAEFQSGTNIFSISKKALQALTIPLPSRQVQDQILRLDALLDEERRVTEALIDNRETQVQGVVQQLLSGAVE